MILMGGVSGKLNNNIISKIEFEVGRYYTTPTYFDSGDGIYRISQDS